MQGVKDKRFFYSLGNVIDLSYHSALCMPPRNDYTLRHCFDHYELMLIFAASTHSTCSVDSDARVYRRLDTDVGLHYELIRGNEVNHGEKVTVVCDDGRTPDDVLAIEKEYTCSDGGQFVPSLSLSCVTMSLPYPKVVHTSGRVAGALYSMSGFSDFLPPIKLEQRSNVMTYDKIASSNGAYWPKGHWIVDEGSLSLLMFIKIQFMGGRDTLPLLTLRNTDG